MEFDLDLLEERNLVSSVKCGGFSLDVSLLDQLVDHVVNVPDLVSSSTQLEKMQVEGGSRRLWTSSAVHLNAWLLKARRGDGSLGLVLADRCGLLSGSCSIHLAGSTASGRACLGTSGSSLIVRGEHAFVVGQSVVSALVGFLQLLDIVVEFFHFSAFLGNRFLALNLHLFEGLFEILELLHFKEIALFKLF